MAKNTSMKLSVLRRKVKKLQAEISRLEQSQSEAERKQEDMVAVLVKVGKELNLEKAEKMTKFAPVEERLAMAKTIIRDFGGSWYVDRRTFGVSLKVRDTAMKQKVYRILKRLANEVVVTPTYKSRLTPYTIGGEKRFYFYEVA